MPGHRQSPLTSLSMLISSASAIRSMLTSDMFRWPRSTLETYVL